MLRLLLSSMMTFLVVSVAQATLQVGAARIDSTPTHLPAVINGNFTPMLWDRVNDPLSVCAIAVDDGNLCVIHATADLCVLPSAVIEQVKDIACKKIPVPREHISMSSTHCHSAPSVMKLLGVDVDPNYLPLFIERASEAIVKAYNMRQPAKMGFGFDFDPENVYCRRFLMKPGKALHVNSEFTGAEVNQAQMNPRAENVIRRLGIPDPTVYVIAFQTLAGKPIALFANYSTHYAGANAISADYFGVFRREITEKISADENFVAVITNGTSGDTNCIDFYNLNRRFDMESVGKSVASAAFRAYGKMTFMDDATLTFCREKVHVNLRKGTPEQVALAKKHLEAHPEIKSMEDAYALNTVHLSTMPDAWDIPVQVVTLGKEKRVGIVLFPNEVYSATGHEIRRHSPCEMTFVMSLSNGYAGYLPTEEDIKLGGYTTWRATSSCCEPKAEEMLRQKAIEMLNSARP